MAEITVKQLMAPIGVIAFVIGTFTTIDTRYAKQADFDIIQDEINKGHKRAELTSKLYTSTRAWADLVSREAMYRAQFEAGTLTNSTRWDDVKQLVANEAAEMAKLNQEIEKL